MANYPLDRFWDRQILDRDRYLGMSSTATARVLLPRDKAKQSWEQVAGQLARRHPYLSCRVREESGAAVLSETSRPVLELREASYQEAGLLWQSHSDLCGHRFRMRRGPLAMLRVTSAPQLEVVELAFSHLLGDALAAIGALGDASILRMSDKKAEDLGPVPVPRLAIPEDMVGDGDLQARLIELSGLQKEAAPAAAKEIIYFQECINAELFSIFKKWLKEKSINAGAVEMLLLAILRVYASQGRKPCLAAIESHRPLHYSGTDLTWGNMAIYGQLAEIQIDPLSPPDTGAWLEACRRMRKQLIAPDQVARHHSFVAALNHVVARSQDLNAIRRLIGSFMHGDHLVVNNLGNFNEVFGLAGPHVLGLGMNDGAQIQDLRLMTLCGRLYCNLSFHADLGLSGSQLWRAMFNELELMMGSAHALSDPTSVASADPEKLEALG